MNQMDFAVQVDRLKNVFGDKSYSDERVKLLWREVCQLDRRWFERTVDSLIASCRYAPLAAEFQEHISAERSRMWQAQKERAMSTRQPLAFGCDVCDDMGIYICTLNGDRSAPYAFRCHCRRGCEDPRKEIPQYKQQHKDDGFKFYDMRYGTIQERRP